VVETVESRGSIDAVGAVPDVAGVNVTSCMEPFPTPLRWGDAVEREGVT